MLLLPYIQRVGHNSSWQQQEQELSLYGGSNKGGEGEQEQWEAGDRRSDRDRDPSNYPNLAYPLPPHSHPYMPDQQAFPPYGMDRSGSFDSTIPGVGGAHTAESTWQFDGLCGVADGGAYTGGGGGGSHIPHSSPLPPRSHPTNSQYSPPVPTVPPNLPLFNRIRSSSQSSASLEQGQKRELSVRDLSVTSLASLASLASLGYNSNPSNPSTTHTHTLDLVHQGDLSGDTSSTVDISSHSTRSHLSGGGTYSRGHAESGYSSSTYESQNSPRPQVQVRDDLDLGGCAVVQGGGTGAYSEGQKESGCSSSLSPQVQDVLDLDLVGLQQMMVGSGGAEEVGGVWGVLGEEGEVTSSEATMPNIPRDIGAVQNCWSTDADALNRSLNTYS